MPKPWRCALLLWALGAFAPAQEQAPAAKPRSFEVAADGTVTVSGRVTFVDRKHDVREKVWGSVRALLWFAGDPGETGLGTEVEIVDGTWTAVFRRPELAGKQPDRLSFHDARIENERVALETWGLVCKDGPDFVLHMRAIPELRVRVVDAATKQDLGNVDVFRGDGNPYWEAGSLHPGSIDLRPLVQRKESSVVVPAPDEVYPDSATTLWIRAPGYAWFPLQVVFAEGGMREAPLVSAGSVKVAVAGKLPEAGVVALRFYTADGASRRSPVLDVKVRATRFEGLAPGRYEARLEHGEWWGEPDVLARAPIEIQPGGEAFVQLVAKDVAAPERVALSGVLVLPEGWRKAGEEVSVTLEPLRGTDRWAEFRYSDLQQGEKEGEYSFTFPDTCVGDYVLLVEPSSYRHIVRAKKGDASDIRIEVPEPVEVAVRVVDRDTKRPRHGVMLWWHPEWPPGAPGGVLEGVSAPADSNEVRMRVPAGSIEVSDDGLDFTVPPTTLRVSRDAREFEVLAATRLGVEVALFEGATRIPSDASSGWEMSLRTLEGVLVPDTGPWGSTTRELATTKAGTYLLRVTAPDGYEPVKDRQVKLGTAPFPTIGIKVVRR
jgi:hypothetical protein